MTTRGALPSPLRLRLRRVLTGVVLALMAPLTLLAPPASAHEMSMAEMQLRELSHGEFVWQWTATEKRPASEDLTPSGPAPAAPKPMCCTAAPPVCRARWR